MTLPATAKQAKGTLRSTRHNSREPMPDCFGNPVGTSKLPLDTLEQEYYDDIIQRLHDNTACAADSYTVAIAARLLAWEQRLKEQYERDVAYLQEISMGFDDKDERKIEKLQEKLNKRAGLSAADTTILMNTLSALGLSPSARGKLMKEKAADNNPFARIGKQFDG